jgi:hypothetical protein
VDAEDQKRNRHHPVLQRRLLQIRNAIQPRRYPVARLQHVARDLGLHRVDVVHQIGRTENARQKDERGESHDDDIVSYFQTDKYNLRSVAPEEPKTR